MQLAAKQKKKKDFLLTDERHFDFCVPAFLMSLFLGPRVYGSISWRNGWGANRKRRSWEEEWEAAVRQTADEMAESAPNVVVGCWWAQVTRAWENRHLSPIRRSTHADGSATTCLNCLCLLLDWETWGQQERDSAVLGACCLQVI